MFCEIFILFEIIACSSDQIGLKIHSESERERGRERNWRRRVLASLLSVRSSLASSLHRSQNRPQSQSRSRSESAFSCYTDLISSGSDRTAISISLGLRRSELLRSEFGGEMEKCNGVVTKGDSGEALSPAHLQKIIIDTDPGIDDAMAILMAFQSPKLEILGLTTVFGNVKTENATQNALLLCEIAGRPDVPVAEGSSEPLKGGRPRVADFVHGSDGLGNISLPPPSTKKIEKSASEFLVEKVSEYPGEVSILALGPLTNLAMAIKRDSSFASKVKRIVILGGAFFSLGNVNPAAEANIYGDPEAADVVFTSGANIEVIGINITTQVQLTDSDLLELKQSKGKYAEFLNSICKFYRDWHVKSDGVHGIFLHDPVSFVALVRPDLFTYRKGVVRVETQGISVGHTLMDQGIKKWNTSNPWSGYSPISVAWTVNVDEVLNYIRKLLLKP